MEGDDRLRWLRQHSVGYEAELRTVCDTPANAVPRIDMVGTPDNFPLN